MTCTKHPTSGPKPYCASKIPHTLWEPAAGRGAIVRVLRDAGHAVIASDLINYGFPLHFQRDFFEVMQAPAGVEAIVTNPAFKDAARFVAHALELCPRVYMLMRFAFFEAGTRPQTTQTAPAH